LYFLPHVTEHCQPKECTMRPLVLIGIALLVLWAVFWLFFRIVTWTIHLLVIVGLLLILWGLLRRGSRMVSQRFRTR
jgi:hypothetical protein